MTDEPNASAADAGPELQFRAGGKRNVEQAADPRALRAIAHPVRNRILDELYAAGSLRAADVARLLDVPANQASFHLRQLAKYGLIEEDPDAARDRRDRVWRAVNPRGLTINLRQLSEAEGGRAAVEVWRRRSEEWGHALVSRAYADPTEHERDAHRMISDHSIRLSKEQAEQLADELSDLVQSWVERTRSAPDQDARTYLLYSILQPYPEPRDE